jgi:hypothetical protein
MIDKAVAAPRGGRNGRWHWSLRGGSVRDSAPVAEMVDGSRLPNLKSWD